MAERINRVLQWLYIRIVLAYDLEREEFVGWGIMFNVRPSTGWANEPSGVFGTSPTIYWVS